MDCCSPGGLCLMTTCLPCITYGKIQHRMEHGNLDDYSCCNGSVSPHHDRVFYQHTETENNASKVANIGIVYHIRPSYTLRTPVHPRDNATWRVTREVQS